MTIDQLLQQGFQGFISVTDLRASGFARIPSSSGVYAVIRPRETPPLFLAKSLGGWFKGKDPTVSVDELKRQWVEGVDVIYFGKANVLNRRIKQFIDFGSGKPVGHWGGRLVWQVEASDTFQIAWLPCENPRGIESSFIQAFRANHGKLPYANLMG